MKNKSRLITIALSVLITLAVLFGMQLCKNLITKWTNQDTTHVTMVQLIANPEKYDGQLIRVVGVGHLEFEGNCISLNKEDWKYSAGHSIWIELDEKAISYEEAKRYNGEYVIIEGIFDKDDRGHMGMFCGSVKNISRYELRDVRLYDTPFEMYSITRNDDLTYSYQITDKNGAVLFSEDNAMREPKIEQVNTDILGVTVQTGTGLSTNWAVYCNTENSKVSETFQYVLMAQGDYVIYVDYEDGEHSIIVQDIFDKSAYYKEYILTDCSAVAGDLVTGAEPQSEGIAVVTYYTGDDHQETELVITLP